MNPLDSESKDLRLTEFMTNIDMEKAQYEIMQDQPHPTDKNRSLLKDAQQRLDSYVAKKERQTNIPGLYNTGEIAGIAKRLREEYYPKPVVKKPEDEEDTKAEEKFEPFYQGEGAGPTEAVNEPEIVSSQPSDQTQTKKTHDHKGKASGKSSKAEIKADFESSPFYGGKLKVDIDADALGSDVSKLNKEYLYDFKHRQRTGQEHSNSIREQRIANMAEVTGITREELYEQTKNHIKLGDNDKSLEGRFTES